MELKNKSTVKELVNAISERKEIIEKRIETKEYETHTERMIDIKMTSQLENTLTVINLFLEQRKA